MVQRRLHTHSGFGRVTAKPKGRNTKSGEDPQLEAEQHESVDQEALNDVSIEGMEADSREFIAENSDPATDGEFLGG